VLHHLSTLAHRLAAVKELLRVLRVGGRGIIYAWAHEQMKGSRRRFEEGRQDFMVPWNLDKRFAFATGAGNDAAEAEEGQTAPSEDGEAGSDDSSGEASSTKAPERVVVQRYCHMFKQGELESLVELAGGAQVEESYYDESNWAVVLRRVSWLVVNRPRPRHDGSDGPCFMAFHISFWLNFLRSSPVFSMPDLLLLCSLGLGFVRCTSCL
jgi:hypothetical protein